MNQGQIDHISVTPVRTSDNGEGYQFNIVMKVGDDLLQVGGIAKRQAGCDALSDLMHSLAREIKKLPKVASCNQPTLKAVK
ncbi:MAG: hypothetical protein KAS93_07960 [Gammaproteobacteria bacterium]|nr:hypothetical protein [Gammaproteobacteria bacterium]